MRKHRIETLVILALTALTALTALAASSRESILSLKESISDDNIVFPYSFETNTQEMMKNWYLQNYAVLDQEVESKDPNLASDREYIKRLKSLPSGIELPFNSIVKSYIERYIIKERTMVSEMLGMSPYYMPIFEQALEKEGMPHELKYIPVIESALDPNSVSRVGATGLWQFMLDTGKNLGLEVNSLVDERRDPYRSSEAAVKYFKQLYAIYGDWSLAIAAYNCGPGNVNKALLRANPKDKQHKPDFWEIYNYLPTETRGYVPAFIAANYVMNYYKEHNINPSLATKPLIVDTVKVSHRLHFDQISSVLNIPIEEIRILNPQYRHDVIPGDSHPYTLALPSQQIYSYIMVEDSIINYKPELYASTETRNPGTPNEEATALESASTAQVPSTAKPAPSQNTRQEKATSHKESGNSGSNSPVAATAGSPSDEATLHKVARGEDIESIAKKYGTTVEGIMALNDLKRRHVSRGQVLKVPGEPKPAPPASKGYTAHNKPTAPAPNTAQHASTGTSTPYKGNYHVDVDVPAPAKAKSAPRQSEEETSSKRSKAEHKQADKDNGSDRKASKRSETRRGQAEKEDNSDRKASKRSKARRGQVEKEDNSDRKASKRSKARREEEANKKATPTHSRRNRARQREQEEKKVHNVTNGESLERIARHNGVTVSELKKANPQYRKDEMIHPGDKVVIPKKKSTSSRKRKSQAEEEKPKKRRSSSRKRG